MKGENRMDLSDALQMNQTTIEQFHTKDGKHIIIYTDGLYQIVDDIEIIVIEDGKNPDMFYDVMLYGHNIEFSSYGLDSPDRGGKEYVNMWQLRIDLAEWDVMLLDTEAEILITRSWDIYRIPFRYLLQSYSEDYSCHNLEFLGNYAPDIEEWIFGIVEIRGKEYDIDRLCLK